MSKKLPKVYSSVVKYKDKFDLTTKMLNLYACIVSLQLGDNDLRPRLVQALVFYIMFGHSDDTKKLIRNSLNINKENLNTINSELTRKGYLIRDTRNYRRQHLSSELEKLKQYFLDEESSKKHLVITLIK